MEPFAQRTWMHPGSPPRLETPTPAIWLTGHRATRSPDCSDARCEELGGPRKAVRRVRAAGKLRPGLG